MNDILDIEVILKKQKYHPIYNIGIILLIIIFIFFYISITYKYKTYFITKGIIEDGKVKILIGIDELKYILNNNSLEINNLQHKYKIEKLSEELYVDENFNNYKYIHLKIDGINNINNYVYELKIKKEEKKIISYLKDYL